MFIGEKDEKKLQLWFEHACAAYKNSDAGRWEAARWCAKIVGKYERGATIGLASDMGVSPDTVENLAHAYLMFIELASRHKYRSATRMEPRQKRLESASACCKAARHIDTVWVRRSNRSVA